MCRSIRIFEELTKTESDVLKKMIIPFIFILFFPTLNILGQEHPSIHQIEYEKYKSLPKRPSSFDVSGAGIIPFQNLKNRDLSVSVFGYLPYWKYPDALANLQFDLLTHISVFDFSVQSDGSISTPSAWPWTDLINAAHEAGVKIILTAVNFDGGQIHGLLTDTMIKQNFFHQAKELMETYSLQGVNIDFENVRQNDRGEVLNEFMADFTAYLHEEVPESEVSIAVMPINWGGWLYAGLAESCDYLFIMGYNFYGPWSQTSGPCAPLTGGTYNLTRTVNTEFAEAAENNADKLILGVPYYGNKWQTATGNSYSQAINHISQPSYSLARNTADDHGSLWDNRSQTSYCVYQENGDWYQVWYDTDTSLGLKYDLADSKHYKGIGMWALGYDSNKPELWDEIRKKYTGTSAIDEFYQKKIHIHIIHVSSGKIEVAFSAEKNEHVFILCSSMNGQIIYQNQFTAAASGTQNTDISTQNLLSGIYIVKVWIKGKNSLRTGTEKLFIR